MSVRQAKFTVLVFFGRNASGEYVWLREPGDLDSLDLLPNDLRHFLNLLPPEREVPSMKRTVADVALEKALSEAHTGRDNACFRLAKQLQDNNYSQMEAESVCLDFVRRVSSTNTKGQHEPFTDEEARAKVASAYSYAKREPWASTTPYRPASDHSSTTNGNRHMSSAQPELMTIVERLTENEYGDGLLFAQVFDGQVCYDHSEKAWYLWNKHHWKKDTTGKIKQLVSGHLGSIYLKARGDVHKQIVDTQAEVERLQKEDKNNEYLSKLNDQLKYLAVLMDELEKRARALRSATRMKNVLMFGMSEHNIGITSGMWDTDPWLLGVANGVVNLKTGKLRDGQPTDYIRSVSPTEWHGLDAPCPRFEQFLQEILELLPAAQLAKLTNGEFHQLPEDEQKEIVDEHRDLLIQFLQRLLGYAVAGLSTEAIFPLLYGEEGRNGKDTLFKVLKFVLGLSIADAISNDVFLSTDRGRAAGAATPHLADLQGKRMVWGSETKQGDRINVSQVKQLTGGGDISARKNYGDQYTFMPTHTLFLMTNYKPHADAKDKAFWSRACLIEFALRFVDNPQADNERKVDTNLAEDLKAEASGILAWLVRGCLDYQQQGLNRPLIVEMSTEAYRASEDNIQQFIDECCVCNEKAHVGAKMLYDTYVSWCKDNNLHSINGKLFGEDMSKRFAKIRSGKGLEYRGIGILIDETLPEDPFSVGSKVTNVGSNGYPLSRSWNGVRSAL
jgi:putative DNA primase/helicase